MGFRFRAGKATIEPRSPFFQIVSITQRTLLQIYTTLILAFIACFFFCKALIVIMVLGLECTRGGSWARAYTFSCPLARDHLGLLLIYFAYSLQFYTRHRLNGTSISRDSVLVDVSSP